MVYCFVIWFSQVYQGSIWLKFYWGEGEFLPPCEIFACRTERSHLWKPCGPTPAITPWNTDAKTTKTWDALCPGHGPAVKGNTGQSLVGTRDPGLVDSTAAGMWMSISQEMLCTLSSLGREAKNFCSSRCFKEVTRNKDCRKCISGLEHQW